MKRLTSNFDVVEKELVFDIDISDYDSVRTCCKEANVCNNCWKLMSLACKILDTALRGMVGFYLKFNSKYGFFFFLIFWLFIFFRGLWI